MELWYPDSHSITCRRGLTSSQNWQQFLMWNSNQMHSYFNHLTKRQANCPVGSCLIDCKINWHSPSSWTYPEFLDCTLKQSILSWDYFPGVLSIVTQHLFCLKEGIEPLISTAVFLLPCWGTHFNYLTKRQANGLVNLCLINCEIHQQFPPLNVNFLS